MEMATAFMGSIFGGGATAAAGAAAGGAAAGGAALGGAAAGGLSLAKLLSGTATVLGMVNSINAGRADAEMYNAAADDAAREKPLEALQGITRRSSIKQSMMDRVGEQDVAYAASGTDLSFGTPGQARKDAFREADLGLETDNGTEQTRVARLSEREAEYRKRASRAKKSAMFDALTAGLTGFSNIAKIGGTSDIPG